MNLYPASDIKYDSTNVQPTTQFLADAKAGTLPSFSFIDPNYDTTSQENPQNIAVGETFLRSIVEAVGSSPLWRKTILIITYDEHGGYYDHVPPPVALAPDDIAPVNSPGEKPYDGFRRYGFRVPSVVVSPYAKQDYVSHLVYDHSSVLAFLERKFNLPALTKRDANANDLFDFLDLTAMAKGQPTFPEFPALANAGGQVCTPGDPGTIPAPIGPAILQKLKLSYTGPNKKKKGLGVKLQCNHSEFTKLTVELVHGRKVVGKLHVGSVNTVAKALVLREKGKLPAAGRYTIKVVQGRKTLAKRAVHVR
jgi:phospholipase C